MKSADSAINSHSKIQHQISDVLSLKSMIIIKPKKSRCDDKITSEDY